MLQTKITAIRPMMACLPARGFSGRDEDIKAVGAIKGEADVFGFFTAAPASVMLKEMCCPSAGRRVRVVKAARARKISWPVSSMVAAPKPRLLFQRVIVP